MDYIEGFDVTEVDWASLRRAATDVMTKAYVPYSRFPVGAAALVDDGRSSRSPVSTGTATC
jgi:cytidine deaminase